jgi:hypothetical protein
VLVGDPFEVGKQVAPGGRQENVAHTLANHSDAAVCTPAGFERHWARIAADVAGVEPPQWALQPIPEVTVVGPQIAAQA